MTIQFKSLLDHSGSVIRRRPGNFHYFILDLRLALFQFLFFQTFTYNYCNLVGSISLLLNKSFSTCFWSQKWSQRCYSFLGSAVASFLSLAFASGLKPAQFRVRTNPAISPNSLPPVLSMFRNEEFLSGN